MSGSPNRRSRLMDFIPRKRPGSSNSHQPLNDPDSPHGYAPSLDYSSQSHSTNNMYGGDALEPPTRPFLNAPRLRRDSSGLSADDKERPLGQGSRTSSFMSMDKSPGIKERPVSLSVNYVPAKFSKLHAPGEWRHRKGGKLGGGRDAFAKDASRMGMMGTVDDDEGVVFQIGKGGLKKKKPKLRWNRFKWVLFVANAVLITYGMATLIAAILVWLNVFYQSDVIRVGNRVELILSTVAASLIVFTSLLGYSGILLNNRGFLAVYTLMLWVCLAFIVAPGYLTYKQRTFNLEGKINSQWSRELGSSGRLRIQDALHCCGYFSPYIEATQSPLCYPRSNEPGCKARYLRLERYVLETWYIISFSLVPAHIFIIIGSLLSSNHITYRFGKGLTPKRYRLDLGSMAVIMDEYASQIAAQYGDSIAGEIRNRSSVAVDNSSPFVDEPIHQRISRAESFGSMGTSTGAQPGLTHVNSRLTSSQYLSTGAAYDGSEGRPRSQLANEVERYADSDYEGYGEGHTDESARRPEGAGGGRRTTIGWAS